MNRRALEPLRYGPHQCARRREYVLAAVALILALWYAVGGDRAEDRILYAAGQWQGDRVAQTHTGTGTIERNSSNAITPAAPMLCPKLRDGLWLRWQIEHQSETGFNWHRCAYGPVWREVARQEGM